MNTRGRTGLLICGFSVCNPAALVCWGVPRPPQSRWIGVFCRDLDVHSFLYQTPPRDIAHPNRFWYAFGLCGPVPAEKRFLIH
jgi:hypothetical protein